MRPCIAIVLGTALLASSAEAKCLAGAIHVLPDDGKLPANGQLVLTGQGRAADWVAQLQSASLVAPGDRVQLRASEHLPGPSEQVVLVPERALQVGKTYRLHAARVREEDRYTLTRAQWTASAADRDAPTWHGPPRVTSQRRSRLGCGDSEHVVVATPLTDDGNAPLLVRASIRSATTTSTFVVPVVDGSVSLGHGMCDAQWVPRQGEHYTIALTALDAAGHASAAPQPLALRFDTEEDAGVALDVAPPDAGAASPAASASAPPPAASCSAAASRSSENTTPRPTLALALALVALGRGALTRATRAK